MCFPADCGTLNARTHALRVRVAWSRYCMAGTYLQQDAYGEIPGVVPRFDKNRMTDEDLIALVQSHPAVHEARHRCDWIVATAMYQQKAGTLKPPWTNASACWLAFVDRDEHSAAGWTKVPLVLFSSYERNENAVKAMLPAILPRRPIVYVNHVLPQARCLGLSHLTRARDLDPSVAARPHLFASRIPGWSGRSHLPGYLEMAKGYLERRNASADLLDFGVQLSRMAREGFNTSQWLPVVDTLWMIWPTGDKLVEQFSRDWLHEVAHFSSFEKVSYSFVVWRHSDFRVKLVDAIYVYAPQQRVCPGDVVHQSTGDQASIASHRHGRSRRGRRMRGVSSSASLSHRRLPGKITHPS